MTTKTMTLHPLVDGATDESTTLCPKTSVAQVDGLESSLASKQDALVSGTSIKTVNGESLLGAGNITIAAPTVVTATSREIRHLFATQYAITTTVANGTYAGDSDIWSDETACVTIVPTTGYFAPDGISVTGASSSYDRDTGVAMLYGPTSDVAVSATCVDWAKLATPTASLSGSSLTMSTNDTYTKSFAVYSDGAQVASVALGYDVTVAFADGQMTYSWQLTQIYGDYSVSSGSLRLLSADQIGSIPTADGSTTVSCETGRLLVFAFGGQGVHVGSKTVSGGLSAVSLGNVDSVYIDGLLVSMDTSSFIVEAYDVSSDGGVSYSHTHWGYYYF